MKVKLFTTLLLSLFIFSCSGNKDSKQSATSIEKSVSNEKTTQNTKITKKTTKTRLKTNKLQKSPKKTIKIPIKPGKIRRLPSKPVASTTKVSPKIKKIVDKAMAKSAPKVKMETSMGTIVIELNPKKAPISVRNFLTYVAEGFYNGTIFHRIITTFMIQGGGFTTAYIKKTKGLHSSIKNEATNGLENKRGTIAMARTRVVDSAQAQFFINVVDNKSLNHRGNNPRAYGYAVFGKVVKGMDVVDKIKDTPTKRKGVAFRNAPVKDVVIKSVTILP